MSRPPPPLRICARFREGLRWVVELRRQNGKAVWVEGSTKDEAERRAAEEIAAADRRA